MKLNKVAIAIASALAIASGTTQAGQINSSSTTLATEVIWSDSQVVRAPSNAYTFSGDIDARTNEQRLQLQYTINKGQWASGGLVPATGLSADLLSTGVLKVAYKDAADLTQTALPSDATVKAFLANSGTTLVFNVTIPASASISAPDAIRLLRNAVWTLNSEAVVGTDNVGLTKLKTVAGTVACPAPDVFMNINFKHFTNHTGTAVIQSDASPDAEHLRVGSTNDARFLGFTQDLRFNFVRATSNSQVNSATLRTTFLNTTTTYSGISGVPANRLHTLGTVTLARISNGLDLDYTTQYGALLDAAAFDTTLAAWIQDGKVDVGALGLTIKVNGNMAKGSQIALVDSLGAAVGSPSTALTADATTTTVSLTTAANIAKVAAGLVKVVYVVDGVNVIPDNGDFTVVATLNKDVTGAVATDTAEQNNVCEGTLAGLGNSGIKIDVRNYASFAKFGAAGPATTLRIINNSETRTADVYAQMIYADGTYGAWGKLPDLAPRAVMNISNKNLEALMTNAAAATNPFGSNATGYVAAGGAAVSGAGAAGVADRVRIISNTGSTLRVQSYMVLGNVVMDTSGGQGVDFENTAANRAPTDDAQPLSQDAINGLSK